MIFQGMEFMNEIPFKQVYIYATVLNKEGRRMSKSLGTGIDPLELIDEYGADATRFGIVMQAGKGQDMRFGTDRTEMARNFANKIWNAARFVLMNLGSEAEPEEASKIPDTSRLQLADRWILSRLHETIRIVNDSFGTYDFDEACKALYSFIWSEYCDWYLELAKPRLQSESTDAAVVRAVLSHVQETTMRLLHPLMPFITEEIWQTLPHDGDSIMVADYPVFDPERIDKEAESQMELLMELARSIRNIRAELGVAPGKEIAAFVISRNADVTAVLEANKGNLESLTRTAVTFSAEPPAEKSLTALVGDIHLYVPVMGLIDVEKETQRLKTELAGIEKELMRVNNKLSNEQFLSRAPAEVVEKEHRIRKELMDRRAKILERQALIGE
jgi:valyl-tRNA synthetase